MCGTIRLSDGALLCNWQFVTCRDGRVTGIYLSDVNASLAMLPKELAGATSLEVIDIRGSQAVMGGTLPAAYSALKNMTTFR